MSEYTFTVNKDCPVCGESTRVVKVKSRLPVTKTDLDFCVHYENFNPYFYRIWFCEHCGYAADEKHFLANMSSRKRDKLWQVLGRHKLAMEFTEERGVPEAVASYMMAIHYAEIVGESYNTLASLHLALAWVYRDSGEKEKEVAEMHRAADLYDISLNKERYPIGNMSDDMVIYLVGAIYYMLNEKDKTLQYLSRLIGDKGVRVSDRKLYDKVRDLWQDVRAEKEKEKAAKADSTDKKQAGRTAGRRR